MKTTKIEWTDKTWNPVTGCTKVSAGCAHCYAENMARRLCAMGQEKYKNNFTLALHENALDEPLLWRKPHTIFVCSMSDLFHEKVPFSFIDKVLNTIIATPQHRYQLLTKRSARMAKYFETRIVPENVWLGVTVEIQAAKGRIDLLGKIPAPIRFLSCEPLIEDIGELNLANIDWVIVGGESGKMARPMKEEWVLSIERQAAANGSAFFFKQWGTWGADGIKRSKYANGKLLKGKIRQTMPVYKGEEHP
jgi:protein gp37